MVRRNRGRPTYDQKDVKAAAAFKAVGRSIKLDRADEAPLWIQLKNGLDAAIGKGVLVPNSRMPSEQALCGMFGISKPVVRAALGALASEGRVIKIPRKGMFVAPRREDADFIASNLGVFGDLTSKGHKVTTRTFELYRAAPDEREQEMLSLPPEGSVVRIGRVYLSDGSPITMTRISLPGHKVPGMELLDIENRSIFSTIREKYGLTVQRSERWFMAAMPTAEAVERMGIAPDTPLIAIESIAYDPTGAPLEYYRAVCNSAVARIHIAVGQAWHP